MKVTLDDAGIPTFTLETESYADELKETLGGMFTSLVVAYTMLENLQFTEADPPEAAELTAKGIAKIETLLGPGLMEGIQAAQRSVREPR